MLTRSGSSWSSPRAQTFVVTRTFSLPSRKRSMTAALCSTCISPLSSATWWPSLDSSPASQPAVFLVWITERKVFLLLPQQTRCSCNRVTSLHLAARCRGGGAPRAILTSLQPLPTCHFQPLLPALCDHTCTSVNFHWIFVAWSWWNITFISFDLWHMIHSR